MSPVNRVCCQVLEQDTGTVPQVMVEIGEPKAMFLTYEADFQYVVAISELNSHTAVGQVDVTRASKLSVTGLGKAITARLIGPSNNP